LKFLYIQTASDVEMHQKERIYYPRCLKGHNFSGKVRISFLIAPKLLRCTNICLVTAFVLVDRRVTAIGIPRLCWNIQYICTSNRSWAFWVEIMSTERIRKRMNITGTLRLTVAYEAHLQHCLQEEGDSTVISACIKTWAHLCTWGDNRQSRQY